MAMSIELLLVPNQSLDGWIVGMPIILFHLSGLQIGLFIYLLNIPFFFIGYKQIGKTFALSTVLGITFLSISTYFLHPD